MIPPLSGSSVCLIIIFPFWFLVSLYFHYNLVVFLMSIGHCISGNLETIWGSQWWHISLGKIYYFCFFWQLGKRQVVVILSVIEMIQRWVSSHVRFGLFPGQSYPSGVLTRNLKYLSKCVLPHMTWTPVWPSIAVRGMKGLLSLSASALRTVNSLVGIWTKATFLLSYLPFSPRSWSNKVSLHCDLIPSHIFFKNILCANL